MRALRRHLARSDAPVARFVRSARRAVLDVSMPVPRVIVRPVLGAFLAVRGLWHFALRVLICEPMFRAYCTRSGRRLRTGIFLHWVQGDGDLIVGDDVTVDGKCSFHFASRFSDRPTVAIGDGTIIGHNGKFTVGKSITIGERCLIASDVWMFDSGGHPADPDARAQGRPPSSDEVRPIVVGDLVWIGGKSTIFPGVTVGSGSVISAGSVVMSDVPPRTVVAGNPARPVRRFAEPSRSNGHASHGIASASGRSA